MRILTDRLLTFMYYGTLQEVLHEVFELKRSQYCSLPMVCQFKVLYSQSILSCKP